MAQLNITLNQDEILQLLANDRDFAFKKLLQDSLNSILKVPKHRDGEAFKTFVFDNYCRSEAALIVTMAEMCVNGISTRKVSQLIGKKKDSRPTCLRIVKFCDIISVGNCVQGGSDLYST